MTWLEPKSPDEEKEQVGFRCPKYLKKYVSETAKKYRRKDTEVWVSIARFYKDLGDRLSAHQAQLSVFAASEGLEMPDDIAEVLARLIEKGLTDTERGKRR